MVTCFNATFYKNVIYVDYCASQLYNGGLSGDQLGNFFALCGKDARLPRVFAPRLTQILVGLLFDYNKKCFALMPISRHKATSTKYETDIPDFFILVLSRLFKG